jgi:hypothetical protein
MDSTYVLLAESASHDDRRGNATGKMSWRPRSGRKTTLDVLQGPSGTYQADRAAAKNTESGRPPTHSCRHPRNSHVSSPMNGFKDISGKLGGHPILSLNGTDQRERQRVGTRTSHATFRPRSNFLSRRQAANYQKQILNLNLQI